MRIRGGKSKEEGGCGVVEMRIRGGNSKEEGGCGVVERRIGADDLIKAGE